MMKLNFEKMDGLIPAVIQDALSAEVLMLGFMSEEAFNQTLTTGRITFFSRSKKRLWTKGETSGNFLELVSWSKDCDADSLLFQVKAKGPVCHLETKSCFEASASRTRKSGINFINELESLIDQRSRHGGPDSYTSQLMQAGIGRIAQKVGEEAVETVIALMGNSGRSLIDESADLIYHLIVGLKTKGLGFNKVVECLEQRHHLALMTGKS